MEKNEKFMEKWASKHEAGFKKYYLPRFLFSIICYAALGIFTFQNVGIYGLLGFLAMFVLFNLLYINDWRKNEKRYALKGALDNNFNMENVTLKK